MTLLQLRILRETVRHEFNLSKAADTLCTSQSGLSKHIKDLEHELGMPLFQRHGKRLLGLSEGGQAILPMVNRIIQDSENLKGIAQDLRQADQGQLTIATTHTQARYTLPKPIAAFKQQFPKVHLALKQADPNEIRELVLAGDADIGIATEVLAEDAALVSLPFYEWQHCVIAPRDHPLSQLSASGQAALTLSDICQWPLITYHDGFTGRSRIDRTFQQAGLTPDIVLSALDADVIKTYVALGMGIGIIAGPAFDPEQDQRLSQIPVDFFGKNTTWIAFRKGHLLRGFARTFIQLCNPEILSDSPRNPAAAMLHRP